jgi:hypothetical protein
VPSSNRIGILSFHFCDTTPRLETKWLQFGYMALSAIEVTGNRYTLPTEYCPATRRSLRIRSKTLFELSRLSIWCKTASRSLNDLEIHVSALDAAMRGGNTCVRSDQERTEVARNLGSRYSYENGLAAPCRTVLPLTVYGGWEDG